MASTFTDLGIELMATGENAGTWGTKTNANLSLIEQLTGGYNSQAVTDSGTPTALTIAEGALTGTAQQRVIELTGSISGSRVVTFPLLTENFYIIKNSTSGAQTVQIKAVSGSGATVTFATDDKGYKLIYLDGVATNTGVFEATVGASGDVTLTGTQTLTNKTLTSPKIGTSILDTGGNELFKLTATGSAVNELTYANAATGNKPTFTASGGDTNIGIAITPKGSGAVVLDGLSYPTADGSADQVLSTNGSGVLSFVTTGGGYESVQVFTSNGTWSRPTGITKVRVIVVGGGGGGGGCPTSHINGAGQGGGAGGTAIETIDVSSTSSTPVTIGSGGAAQAGGSTSSFGPFCSGAGGGAGQNADSIANPPGGGAATGSGGDYNLRGGNGGGGSKGTVPNSRTGGFGGNSFLGGGGFGSCGNEGGAGQKGGGGGGASSNQPPTVRSGGAGGDGIVIVEEYK